MVLLNNEKGSGLLENLVDKIYKEARTLDEAIKGNPALLTPIPMGEKRKEFFEGINHQKYSKLVWQLIGVNWKQRNIRYMKHKFRVFKQKMKGLIK